MIDIGASRVSDTQIQLEVTSLTQPSATVYAVPYLLQAGKMLAVELATGPLPLNQLVEVPAGNQLLLAIGPDGEVSESLTLFGYSPMSSPSVQLVREQSPAIGSSHRLVVRAVDPLGHDGNIFLFQHVPASAFQPLATNQFLGVAKPGDMDEYAVGQPNVDEVFFRLSTLDLTFRNLDTLIEAWTEIQADVSSLMGALKILSSLHVEEVLQVGS